MLPTEHKGENCASIASSAYKKIPWNKCSCSKFPGKGNLLYEYFRSAETACEPNSNILWFSHQNPKYPSNLNLGVKADPIKGTDIE